MTINLPLLAAAATGVQVGAAIVASRFVVAEVPPLTLALLRYAIGLACLLPFVLQPFRAFALQGRAQGAIKSVAIRDLAAMAALGAGQVAVLIALLNYGLQQLGAAQAALIFSLLPLLTLLLSAALGRERITPALLAGVLLSIAGVAVSLAPKLGGEHAGSWWGELAVLASACTGALCSVLYRPYLRRYPHTAGLSLRDAGLGAVAGAAGRGRRLARPCGGLERPELGRGDLHRPVQRPRLLPVAVCAQT